MLTRFAAATALCLTLGLSPVIAGTTSGTAGGTGGTAATAGAGTAGTAAVTPVQRQQPGQWLADDLIGSNVYNQQGENIGDLNDLLIGQDGKISAIVVGVGGFLGIGERDVAIPWDQVQMRPAAEVRRTADTNRPAGTGTTTGTAGTGTTATGTTTGTGTAGTGTMGTGTAGTAAAPTGATGTTTATRTDTGTTAADRREQDMRIVVNATRDQLRNMPQFRSLDDQDRGRGDDTRGGATAPADRPAAGGPAGAPAQTPR